MFIGQNLPLTPPASRAEEDPSPVRLLKISTKLPKICNARAINHSGSLACLIVYWIHEISQAAAAEFSENLKADFPLS
jgi:hypothetical protein